MSDPNNSETQLHPEADESFGDLLTQFEQSHKHRIADTRQLEGTVVAVSADSVFLDIGYKTEGILPLSAFRRSQRAEARRQVSGHHQGPQP